ncbi:hypothetical protein, partial [Pseudomonas avellanae]|uniref:hypothetical protein n=1 Tax=Pseudomonas avellanae TaxID=46257 RepID=UPI001ED997D0
SGLVHDLSGTDSKTGTPGTSKSPVLRGHQDLCNAERCSVGTIISTIVRCDAMHCDALRVSMQFPAFDYRADAPRRCAVLDALRPILHGECHTPPTHRFRPQKRRQHCPSPPADNILNPFSVGMI